MNVGLGEVKNIMGYNGVIGQYDLIHPKLRVLMQMGYSPYFEYNVNIMSAVQVLALVLYGIYALVHYICMKKYRDEK
jgi:hypothetical protein